MIGGGGFLPFCFERRFFMNEAMLSFLSLIEAIIPFSLAWGLGIKAYRFVIGAFLGKDARL